MKRESFHQLIQPTQQLVGTKKVASLSEEQLQYDTEEPYEIHSPAYQRNFSESNSRKRPAISRLSNSDL